MTLKNIEASDNPTSKDVLVIATNWPEPTETLDRIRHDYPGITVIYHELKKKEGNGPYSAYGYNYEEIPKDLLAKATILLLNFFSRVDPKDVPNLQILHYSSAGVDYLKGTPVWENEKISIISSNGVHGPQISEWILMYILFHSHKGRQLESFQQSHHWGKTTGPVINDLVKQRIGILAYGSIGRQVARVTCAMGMEVYAYTASPRNTPESKKDTGYIVPGTGDPNGEFPAKWFSGTDKESLHKFLGSGLDILVLSVPLTDDTVGLLGKDEFEVLKKAGKNSFICNISRGPVVDHSELAKALKTPLEDGGLRGAALDVTDPEPLPDDSELWGIENLYISPHVSGNGATYFSRVLGIMQLNLKRRAAGEKLANVVDRKKGY